MLGREAGGTVQLHKQSGRQTGRQTSRLVKSRSELVTDTRRVSMYDIQSTPRSHAVLLAEIAVFLYVLILTSTDQMTIK